MKRYASLLAICLTAAVAFSWSVSASGVALSSSDMKQARGGDQNSARCVGYCDVLSGVYLACQAVGGDCTQCGTLEHGQFQSSQADYIGNPGDPGCTETGGYQETEDSQDCGTIWNGTCEADPNSPSGFACVLVNSGNVCTIGIPVVETQPGGSQ